MNNVNCEAGAWQDNLTIGHYGVCTLRPEKDIMKRTGAPDGWIADLVSSRWKPDFANSAHGGNSSAADTHVCGDEDWNANREFLDVLMPYKLEINEIRLQGIRQIDIGGRQGFSVSTDHYNTGDVVDAGYNRDNWWQQYQDYI